MKTMLLRLAVSAIIIWMVYLELHSVWLVLFCVLVTINVEITDAALSHSIKIIARLVDWERPS